MPDYDNGNRAQQQLRDLGNVTRQAARELNRSSPTAAEGSRILREYEQRVAQTLLPPPAPQKPLPQAPKKKRSWLPWKRKKDEYPPFRCGTGYYYIINRE
jgi:hypothetical protein